MTAIFNLKIWTPNHIQRSEKPSGTAVHAKIFRANRKRIDVRPMAGRNSIESSNLRKAENA